MEHAETRAWPKSCGVTVVLSAERPYVEFRNYFPSIHSDRKVHGNKTLMGFSR